MITELLRALLQIIEPYLLLVIVFVGIILAVAIVFAVVMRDVSAKNRARVRSRAVKPTNLKDTDRLHELEELGNRLEDVHSRYSKNEMTRDEFEIQVKEITESFDRIRSAPELKYSDERLCKYCGSSIPENSLFCDSCGRNLRTNENV